MLVMTKDQKYEQARYFTYHKVYQKWLQRAEKLGFKTVRDMLKGLYHDQGRTSYSVALLVGFSQMAILKMMRRLDVSRRPAGWRE